MRNYIKTTKKLKMGLAKKNVQNITYRTFVTLPMASIDMKFSYNFWTSYIKPRIYQVLLPLYVLLYNWFRYITSLIWVSTCHNHRVDDYKYFIFISSKTNSTKLCIRIRKIFSLRIRLDDQCYSNSISWFGSSKQ